MKKTILVEFTEQSKSVVANTRIIYEVDEGDKHPLGDDHFNDGVLRETKELFEKAQSFALEKTLKRLS
jgi:hypothetical protein